MKKKFVFMAAPAIALVFALTLIGCPQPTSGGGSGGSGGSSGGSGGGSGGNDANLVGTWVNIRSNISGDKYKFTSSTYEYQMNTYNHQIKDSAFILRDRGTYTTNNGNIKFTPTDLYGAWVINVIKNDYNIDAPLTDTMWYSKSELKAALTPITNKLATSDKAHVEERIELDFKMLERTYSVSGNKLTIIEETSSKSGIEYTFVYEYTKEE